MNQPVQQPGFTLVPGQGYVFREGLHDDIRTKAEAAAKKRGEKYPQVALFGGHLMLPGHERVRVEMKGSTRTGKYEVLIRQLPKDQAEERSPEDWQTIGQGELPLFGKNSYIEARIDIRGRKYLVRCIRRQNDIMFNLPQVLKSADFDRAVL